MRRADAPLLAIEVATAAGGVALLEGPRLLAERALDDSQRSAASLLVALDELLRASGRELDDFDLIALSIGPGSFTGLRVGLATALGLCFETERRIVPVPTLAALATHAPEAERVVPMLDARRGEVYAGLYTGSGRALQPDRVCEPAALLRELEGETGPLAFVGSGALRHADAIASTLGARARVLPAELAAPQASSVGRLGAVLADEGAVLEPAQVELRYLRRPAAEAGRAAGRSPAEPII